MDNSIYVQPCIQVLSPEAIARINESSLRILAEVGIRVDSTKALRVLKAASGVTFLEEQHITIQPETNEETIALDDIARAGAGGNFISSRRTKKLCREAYHSSSIFPRLSFEK
jgi:trimethylamine:corrinoid methyltransferase-like protein